MLSRYYVGVLFLSIALHTIVSGNANATYSPQTGRFLNRDPVRYEGSKWGLYEYISSCPLADTDSSGMCADCKGRGGTPVGGTFMLVDGIEDSEIDENFERWKSPRDRHDRDIPEIERRQTPKPNPKPTVYYVYHKKSYKVSCCKEKDGSMTFEDATEVPIRPRSSEYATGSFTVPSPWVLNSGNKDAYVAFSLPVPFWYFGGSGDTKKCLEKSGMGDIGPKVIKPDSDIKDGETKGGETKK